MKEIKLITTEMFDKYHEEVQEDFVDQNEHLFPAVTLCSAFAVLRKEFAPEIWKEINTNKYLSVQDVQNIYEENLGDDAWVDFYKDLVTILNTTEHTRLRVLSALTEGKEGVYEHRTSTVVKVSLSQCCDIESIKDFEAYVKDKNISFDELYYMSKYEKLEEGGNLLAYLNERWFQIHLGTVRDFLDLESETEKFYTCFNYPIQ